MNVSQAVQGIGGLVALAVIVVAIGVAVTAGWYLVRLGTAPGIVVHEAAHVLACRLVGVPVYDVKFFGFGVPAGYVRHGEPARYRRLFAISVAPFVVNTVAAFAAFSWLAVLVKTGDVRASSGMLVMAIVSGWLGLSVGMQAFPSTGDARALWDRSRSEWRRSPVVLLGLPVIVVIYVANLLSWVWADVCYALGLGIAAFALVGVQLPLL
ncbi:DUF3267 domain-containing protein [Natrinema sp. 74]|uniref:DUF3267 domain-containing protein n=1 Tax=Natrinema sp. 74 TaxID=3384159 RepID=UPI0038D4BDAD